MATSEGKRRSSDREEKAEGAGMRIVFFGTDSFAVPALEALIKAGHHVLALVTEPERSPQTGPDVVAGAWRIPSLELTDSTAGEVEKALKNHAPELQVVAAFHGSLPKGIRNVAREGTIKIHPSLLPRYRGPCPIEWALLNGDTETGVTAFVLDERMDGGPILLAKSTAIGPEENSGELRGRLALLAADVVLEALAAFGQGKASPKPQNEKEASAAPPIEVNAGRIDWNARADVLTRRIRAFTPSPGAFSRLQGHEVRIVRASPEGPASGTAGTVLETRYDGILVACGENTSLRLTQLHLEGQRPMSPSAFVARLHLSKGTCFE